MKKKRLSTIATGELTSVIGVGGGEAKQNSNYINDIYDNVFIMHRDTANRMVKPYKWKAIEAGGQVAIGVVIIEGGKLLTIAPTQAPTALFWSSAAIAGGGVTTADRATAYNDWAGKTNTAAQIAASKVDAITNTAEYAPGYCNLYSRLNGEGNGMAAGGWWLPSQGELMMIYANMRRINYALNLIAGADQLTEGIYWSSTEGSETLAWGLDLSNGGMGRNAKAASKAFVRAVSAF